MKYARIDSQGHMIFEDTSAQNGGKPLPNNYVIRRLSDVKILPKSIKIASKDKASMTDIKYDAQGQDSAADNRIDDDNNHSEDWTAHTAAIKTSPKKVVDLDDGLVDEELNSVPYTDDIQYDKQTKTLGSTPQTDNEALADPKMPLPKPKKPPKLPQ